MFVCVTECASLWKWFFTSAICYLRSTFSSMCWKSAIMQLVCFRTVQCMFCGRSLCLSWYACKQMRMCDALYEPRWECAFDLFCAMHACKNAYTFQCLHSASTFFAVIGTSHACMYVCVCQTTCWFVIHPVMSFPTSTCKVTLFLGLLSDVQIAEDPWSKTHEKKEAARKRPFLTLALPWLSRGSGFRQTPGNLPGFENLPGFGNLPGECLGANIVEARHEEEDDSLRWLMHGTP